MKHLISYIVLALLTILLINISLQFCHITVQVDLSIKCIYLIIVSILALIFGNALRLLGQYYISIKFGFNFVSFSFLKIIWIKQENKIIQKQLFHRISIGELVMNPPEMKDNYLSPICAYILSGPFSNFIFSLVVSIVICYIPISNNFLYIALCYVALFNMFLCVFQFSYIRLISPFDCSVFFSVIRSPIYQRALYNYLSLKSRTIEGNSLKEINFVPYEVHEPYANYYNPLILEMKLFEYFYYLYNYRYKEAEEVIEFVYSRVYVNKIPRYYRNIFICESLYIKILQGKKEEAYEIMRNLNSDQIKFINKKDSIQSLRIIYAINVYLCYDKDRADATYNNCQTIIKKCSYNGLIKNEQELIYQIKESQNLKEQNDK